MNNDFLFRTLSPEEEKEFKEYTHDNWTPSTAINEVWHPVVRDEWEKMDNLRLAAQDVYETIAADLKLGDHMEKSAQTKAIDAVYTSFEGYASERDKVIWANIAQPAKATVVYQTVREYF